ncbi:hypothetical protein [Pseudonocardia endophytica]|uniref:Tocopherol cyclase-like protein n=1 Tax=Pseudonocardia endophytica TaxID=401976 RepID=A0A4R1HXP1_PSEEN|nr:hypothetical protein [Pseudonocardia endophytica]TCK25885.1 hypothetical protein EV378_1712 [Pseudonocardia endophytica]
MALRQSMQKIVAADEWLCHQLPETFATIAHADISWTEKLWGSLFARDGSLQVDVGLGKYHNRNVMDCFAGISRGKEQLTVRASRQLDLEPDRIGVGPVDYEIIEPLRSARFVLKENHVLPIRFDLTVTGVLPPFLERKDAQREPHGFRIQSDLLRYHQASTVRGHVWIDGETIEVNDDEWFGFRDHSWGVRMDVGDPVPDVYKPQRLDQNFILTWSPMYLERPDGSRYEIHHYQQVVDDETTYFSGFVNESDGTQTALNAVRDELKYDPVNRRLRGGTMTFDAGWGETRTVEVEAISDTGFHLGCGLYFGFKGHRHGQWHGPQHIDGERYADVSDPQTAREVHQLRDCVVRVREGDATGYAIFESMVIGEHPRYGLTKESSFL